MEFAAQAFRLELDVFSAWHCEHVDAVGAATRESSIFIDRRQDVRRSTAIRTEDGPIAGRLPGAACVLGELMTGQGGDAHGACAFDVDMLLHNGRGCQRRPTMPSGLDTSRSAYEIRAAVFRLVGALQATAAESWQPRCCPIPIEVRSAERRALNEYDAVATEPHCLRLQFIEPQSGAAHGCPFDARLRFHVLSLRRSAWVR